MFCYILSNINEFLAPTNESDMYALEQFTFISESVYTNFKLQD